MAMGIRLRHVFDGEFIVVTSRSFSDDADALNFLWGVMADGDGRSNARPRR
jgi:hypothetical protein